MATREDIKLNLRSKVRKPERDDLEDALGNSDDLAVRLWLMVNIGDYRRILIPGQSLQWAEDCYEIS